MKKERCVYCAQSVRVVSGRFVEHAINHHPINVVVGLISGESCPMSHEVPWREGTPDAACVKRHTEEHPQVGEEAAFFDLSHLGCFHARVVATVGRDGAVVWGYALPMTADEKEIAGVFLPPDAASSMQWFWRPVSMRTGNTRPWVDAEDVS